ncbi:MAG: TonB-dependent receptor, partial [Candidatus Helarchaeota archaeon]|nr:TonB-dependent receptor [Candidatus Helarchaeota archaeon]
MKSTKLITFSILLIFLGALLIKDESKAQKPKSSTEEILFEPIETIVTASKREQRIQDSPSTISIITDEDIKEFGAMSIPDLLKYVPGIDVMEITSSHWEVNARGLNQIRSNKMLVMIDGRSVYLDYFGGAIWDALPIQMDDIKRIEIIRGPVSALYGANAFSGVINIITKSPRESAGTHVTLDGGNLNNMRVSIIHGGRNGKFRYKFSGHQRNVNSWRDSKINSEKRGIYNAKFDYIIDGKSTVSFDAGIESGSVEQIILSSILKFNGTTNYAKFNYDYLDTHFQLFWNHGNINSPSFVNYGGDTDSKYNTLDGELQHTFDICSFNTITFGGSYRYNTIESNIIDKEHHQHLLAGFIQNEFKPNKKITALIGLRADHHPLVKDNISPRGSLIIKPKINHTFRLSAGRAFRNPAFTDSYLLQPLEPIPLPSPPLPPGSKTEFTIIGNENLSPEKIQTYEFGYQTFLRRKTRIKIDLFYNKTNDFIGTGDFIPVEFLKNPITGEIIIDPITNLPIPTVITQSFVNLGSAEAYGGELGIDLLLYNWMRLRSNYSYLELQNRYT